MCISAKDFDVRFRQSGQTYPFHVEIGSLTHTIKKDTEDQRERLLFHCGKFGS